MYARSRRLSSDIVSRSAVTNRCCSFRFSSSAACWAFRRCSSCSRWICCCSSFSASSNFSISSMLIASVPSNATWTSSSSCVIFWSERGSGVFLCIVRRICRADIATTFLIISCVSVIGVVCDRVPPSPRSTFVACMCSETVCDCICGVVFSRPTLFPPPCAYRLPAKNLKPLVWPGLWNGHVGHPTQWSGDLHNLHGLSSLGPFRIPE
jgi:hypothetical protein